MNIRLTKKLAAALNGVDLSNVRVGQVIDLQDPLAQMLIAECWAEEVTSVAVQSTADDNPPRVNRRRRRDV